MAQLGRNLIRQRKWIEAEPILRECLAVRERVQADAWDTFDTRSLLGASLLGQGQFAEAEPLILAGYEGLKAREARIPAHRREDLEAAAGRIVPFYEAWGRPEKAAAWKARLDRAGPPADPLASRSTGRRTTRSPEGSTGRQR
jgi:hypothetical protein